MRGAISGEYISAADYDDVAVDAKILWAGEAINSVKRADVLTLRIRDSRSRSRAADDRFSPVPNAIRVHTMMILL